MKLNEVYITWNKGAVKVVPRSLGVPQGVKDFAGPDYGEQGYLDPSAWDQSNLPHLFFNWFIALICDWGEERPAADAEQVYDELSEIYEFDEVDQQDLRLSTAA